MNIIGVLHFLGMIVVDGYGWLPSNYKMDTLYIYNFLFMIISWILFKDECIISYLVKRHKEPNYILGSQPENIQDVIELLGSTSYQVYRYISLGVRIISLHVVNQRSLRLDYFFILLLLYFFYTINLYRCLMKIFIILYFIELIAIKKLSAASSALV